jgi:hypothetical protein
MAKKKTNRMPTGERPKQLSGLAYRSARDVGSAAEGAAIAGRSRDFAKKQAAKKTSYSPKPMSANEKRAAGFRGATTQWQIMLKKQEAAAKAAKKKTAPKSLASKVGGAAGSVAKRVKTTAREARDIATAVGTVGNAAYNTVSNKTNPFKATVTSKKNIAGSVKNLAKQVKETRTAALTGKKGTTSAQSGGRARGPKYTTNSGGSFQERELKTGKKRK